MRLVLVDKRPMHQAWQVCRAAASPHRLRSLIHPAQSFLSVVLPRISVYLLLFFTLCWQFHPKCSFFIYFLPFSLQCISLSLALVTAPSLSHLDAASSQSSLWLRLSPLLFHSIEALINILLAKQYSATLPCFSSRWWQQPGRNGKSKHLAENVFKV